jgi:hypothetical protein
MDHISSDVICRQNTSLARGPQQRTGMRQAGARAMPRCVEAEGTHGGQNPSPETARHGPHLPVQPPLALASSFFSTTATQTASTRLTRMAPAMAYITIT